MKRFVLLTLTLVLAVSASKDHERIEMTRSAWGKTIMHWRISGDGAIEYRVVDGPLKLGTDQLLLTRRTKPNAERYRRIVSLLKPARLWAGRELPCVSPMTDQDTGTISWGSEKLDYYAGCYEPETRSTVATLMRAEKQIAACVSESSTKAGPQKGSTQ